jgi:hypothetical protein
MGGASDQQDTNILKISAHGQDKVEVPGGEFIADAQMTRDGQDLVLTAPDGHAVVVEGYFAADPAPMIAAPHGASLSPELVNSFLSASPQYATAGSVSDESPVGAIEEIKGEATVTHADGTSEALTMGAPIYQGDVIETSAQGAVNVVFVDETSMAVSNNARLAVDEYSFDPATESGTTNFSVLRGVFVFTSGLIGRDDPDDVAIETPVGSIGIRGTIIAGNINPGGSSEITVVEGAIVVKNGVMEKTLSVQFETIKLGGFDSDMQDMGVLNAKAVGTAFGSVSDVAPGLFSAINDSVNEQGETQNGEDAPAEDAVDGESSDAPSDTDAQPEEAPQEIKLNEAVDPFKSDVFHEEVGKTAEVVTHDESTASTSALDFKLSAPTVKGVFAAPETHDLAPPSTLKPADARTAPDSGTASGGGTIAGPSYPADAEISDNIGNRIGFSVTGLGDVNNDGFTDFMFSNNSSSGGQNHAYIMYGDADGVNSGNVPALVDPLIGSLNDIDAAAGEFGLIAIPNPTSGNTIETLVKGIGDFDGDGVEDFLVGQRNNDGVNPAAGVAYIVSGATPNTYVSLLGFDSFDLFGSSIDSLGDINNDGYNDVIIGAPNAVSGGDVTGKAYVVLGGPDNGWGSTISLTTLTTTATSKGFSLQGGVGHEFGTSVAGIGDFDGDGYEDFAIGSPGFDYSTDLDAGRVQIYSGKTYNQLLQLIGAPGNVLGIGTEHGLGTEIMGIGDVNGDGKSDIMIGANSANALTGMNEAYIIFGGTTVSNNNISNIGMTGYKISVPQTMEFIGGGAAGDFNGDGFDDFAVVLKNGTDADMYVVYGNEGNHGLNSGDREFTLADLNSANYAYKTTYVGGGDFDYSVSSIGDANGDGFDDLVIGADAADSGNGEVIVVHGREDGVTTYVRDGDAEDASTDVGMVKASTDQQTLVASDNETLHDGGRNDVAFRGSNGDNVITLSNTDFFDVDGGLGHDTLRLGMTGVDFTNTNFEHISQIEELQLGRAGQTVTLTIENIFNLLKSSDNGELKITYASGISDGLLHIDATTATGTASSTSIMSALNEMGSANAPATHDSTASAGGYEVFNIGGYTLYIQDAVMANTAVV